MAAGFSGNISGWCVLERYYLGAEDPQLAAAVCVWMSWRRRKRNKLRPSFNKPAPKRHVYGPPAQWRAALQSDFTSLRSVCAPTCRSLLCLSDTSASLSPLRSPPTLPPPDKVLWGLDRWPSPSLLHNSSASFPESLPSSG